MSHGHDPDSILALAERALRYAETAGATEAEALVTADDARLTRFANSEIHQNVAETQGSINLRVAIGRRVGVASSNRLDDEGLRRARGCSEADDPLGDREGVERHPLGRVVARPAHHLPTPTWTSRNRAPGTA